MGGNKKARRVSPRRASRSPGAVEGAFLCPHLEAPGDRRSGGGMENAAASLLAYGARMSWIAAKLAALRTAISAVSIARTCTLPLA